MDVAIRVAGVAHLDAVLAVHTAHKLDQAAVGTTAAMIMANLTYGCAPTAFIEPVVVVPEHRRRGIATAMLRHVIDDLGERGCDKVQLLSHKRHSGDGAHELYRKSGFGAEAEGFRRYLRSPS